MTEPSSRRVRGTAALVVGALLFGGLASTIYTHGTASAQTTGGGTTTTTTGQTPPPPPPPPPPPAAAATRTPPPPPPTPAGTTGGTTTTTTTAGAQAPKPVVQAPKPAAPVAQAPKPVAAPARVSLPNTGAGGAADSGSPIAPLAVGLGALGLAAAGALRLRSRKS